MQIQPQKSKLAKFGLALVEVLFIIFLFYSNLLMGEFTQSHVNAGQKFIPALMNIFTAYNFLIAIIAALIGYAVFECLRKLF
jgi:hypothetical protein